MGNLKFAPGETNVKEESFSPNVLLFWLRTEIAVTTRRLVHRRPNTLLNVIPLGFQDAAFPLNNIASVGVEVKFSLAGFLVGLISVLVGIALLGSSALLGLVVLLLGLSQLATCFSAALAVTNTAGGVNYLRVSVAQKAKLEQFRDAVNERVFADQEQLRHAEVMSAHNLNTLVQNQQLQATQLQTMARQAGEHAPGPQRP
jgi:hypothetical protein